MPDTNSLLLNGASVSLAGSDPAESLLRWLRRQRLPGTKEGCADGDCGACTVAMVAADAHGNARLQAVNSCLLPLGMLAGREVFTVEALATGEHLHPVQQAMVDCAGSQCGYCTPGFVMSLLVGAHDGALDDAAFEGNLCRCTGYVPIRAAAAAIDVEAVRADRFAAVLRQPRAPLPGTTVESFFSPDSLPEAIALKRRHPDAAWIAGATDLGVELSHGKAATRCFIALDRIPELQTIQARSDAVRIGAGVALGRIEQELRGSFASLDALMPLFAARQVRNRATIGGNLGSASPIGDLLPILLALDAELVLAGPDGERSLPTEGFFLDYRRTARAADELVVAVELPRRPARVDGFLKVAKRQTDDISIVAAAYALELDAHGAIAQPRLAYGGVAATPRRAHGVEQFLHGRRLDAPTIEAACVLLQQAFEPLDDHRASASYRRALCANLFRKFAHGVLAGHGSASGGAARHPAA